MTHRVLFSLEDLQLKDQTVKDSAKSILVWTEWSRYDYLKIDLPIGDEEDKIYELPFTPTDENKKKRVFALMFAIMGPERDFQNPGILLAGRAAYTSGTLLVITVDLYGIAEVYHGYVGIEGQDPRQLEGVLKTRGQISSVKVFMRGLFRDKIMITMNENSGTEDFVHLDHLQLLRQWDAGLSLAISQTGFANVISNVFPKIKWAHQYLGHLLLGSIDQCMTSELNSIPYETDYLESILRISAVLIWRLPEDVNTAGVISAVEGSLKRGKSQMINWIITACDMMSKICPYRADTRHDDLDDEFIMVEDVSTLDFSFIGDCEEHSFSVASTMLAMITRGGNADTGTLLKLANSHCKKWTCGMALVTFPDGSNEVAHSTCIFRTNDTSDSYQGFYCADGVEHGVVTTPNIQISKFQSTKESLSPSTLSFVKSKFSARESYVMGGGNGAEHREEMFYGMKIYRWFTKDKNYIPCDTRQRTIGCYLDCPDSECRLVEIAGSAFKGNIHSKLPLRRYTSPEFNPIIKRLNPLDHDSMATPHEMVILEYNNNDNKASSAGDHDEYSLEFSPVLKCGIKAKYL